MEFSLFAFHFEGFSVSPRNPSDISLLTILFSFQLTERSSAQNRILRVRPAPQFRAALRD